jgi:hypothetical protein
VPIPSATQIAGSIEDPVGQMPVRAFTESVRMFGFDDSEESVRMREFFEWGNQYELNQLAEHLASH